MRRTMWLLLATIGLAILPGMRSQDADSSALAAAQILQRVEQTYARARSYRDAGVVVFTLARAHQTDDGDTTPFARYVTPFRTAFVRTAGFRFECGPASDDINGRFLVWRSGADVRAWSERPRDTEHATTLGAALVVASADSKEVSLRIPKLLVPLEVFAPNLASDLAQAVRQEDVSSDGIACYCIKGTLEDRVHRQAECTLWIDQQRFLVCRTETTAEDLGMIFTTTATYEPEIDVEIGPGELLFDPPRDLVPSARDQEAAKLRASKPPSLSEALSLSMKGKHDEALVEFDRLWNSENKPDWQDQPLSDTEWRLLESIGREAAEHPPTRKHFEDILDALDTEIRGGTASMHDWTRWAQLARTLKLDDRVVQLYVERRSPAGTIRPHQDMDPIVLDTLVDILVERKQYEDAGRLFADPAKRVRQEYASIQGTISGQWTMSQVNEKVGTSSVVADMQKSLRVDVGRLHALTLAAGRKDEAEDVARTMLASDDSIEARQELIRGCLKFGVPCDSILVWLAEIRKRGGSTAEFDAITPSPAGGTSAGDKGH